MNELYIFGISFTLVQFDENKISKKIIINANSTYSELSEKKTYLFPFVLSNFSIKRKIWCEKEIWATGIEQGKIIPFSDSVFYTETIFG